MNALDFPASLVLLLVLNVQVLNNTLQALDNVLQSSGSLLSGQEGGQLATRYCSCISQAPLL